MVLCSETNLNRYTPAVQSEMSTWLQGCWVREICFSILPSVSVMNSCWGSIIGAAGLVWMKKVPCVGFG